MAFVVGPISISSNASSTLLITLELLRIVVNLTSFIDDAGCFLRYNETETIKTITTIAIPTARPTNTMPLSLVLLGLSSCAGSTVDFVDSNADDGPNVVLMFAFKDKLVGICVQLVCKNGTLLGAKDWSCSDIVGLSVGLFVPVGWCVGGYLFVGSSVGTIVGLFVESCICVGSSVGSFVGLIVGLLVGMFVGLRVGLFVGILVGILVGLLVGFAVGMTKKVKMLHFHNRVFG